MIIKVLTIVCATAIALPLLAQPARGADFIELARPATYRSAVMLLVSCGGQKASNLIAHISYRSMDALALLEAERAGIPVPFGRARIAELIEASYLYPFVSEGMPAPVKIPFHIARHYARSSLPWQFENQAWVLGGLIAAASPQ